jgi:hypothetical protein
MVKGEDKEQGERGWGGRGGVWEAEAQTKMKVGGRKNGRWWWW